MNIFYDNIQLKHQDTGYHLISFDGTDVGMVEFKTSLSCFCIDKSKWKKVIASIDGNHVEGFIHTKKGALKKYKISGESPVKRAQEINDLIVSNLKGKSAQEIDELKGLMHLGITKKDYDSDCMHVAKKIFKGIDFSKKKASYLKIRAKHLKDLVSKETIFILDGLYKKLALEQLHVDFFHDLGVTKEEYEQNPIACARKIFVGFNSKSQTDSYLRKRVFLSSMPYAEFAIRVLDDLYQKFALEEIRVSYRFAENLPDELRSNRAFILEAVKLDGWVLRFASENLKNDKEIVLEAVKKNPGAFEFASPLLREDEEIFFTAFSQDPSTLAFAPERLRNNKEFILKIVKEDPLALRFASENLKKDPEIILVAVKQIWMTINYADISLREDKKFIEYCLKEIVFEKLLEDQPSEEEKITYDDLKQVSDGYEVLKKDSIKVQSLIQSAEAINYITNPTKGNLKLLNDRMKSSKIDPQKQKILLEHLILESKCLRCLRLKDINSLRLITALTQEISGYRNEEIKDYLIAMLLYVKQEKSKFVDFLDQLAAITQGKKELILPGLYLTDFEKNSEIKKSLCKMAKIWKDQNKPYLQAFLQMQSVLFESSLSVDKKSRIIQECLKEGLDLPEILARIQSVLVLAKIQKEKLETIEDFSSINLRSFIIQNLISSGFLEDTDRARQQFIDTFLSSRDPLAIFIYTASNPADSEIGPFIKMFIKGVIEGTFQIERNAANSHARYLSDLQKEKWEIGSSKRLKEGLDVIDSDDWQDLFLCGTEVAGSCQRVDQNYYNQSLMGYVLDGKIRILKIAGSDGKIIARSILKIVLDQENHPVLFFEKVYPESHPKQEEILKIFAKERAVALGLPIYERGEEETLHSEANTSLFEYEDAGGGITDGSYRIKGKRIQ